MSLSSLLKRTRQTIAAFRLSKEDRLVTERLRSFRHVSLDLETMSFRPDAAVLSIGVVPFNLHTGLIGTSFGINVDYEADQRAGGSVSEETKDWWESSAMSTAWECSSLNPLHPQDALRQLDIWFSCLPKPPRPRPICGWSMGSEFDPPIINSFARRHSFVGTWSPRHLKESDFVPRSHLCDVRTALHMFPMFGRPDKVSHTAVGDAFDQANRLIRFRNYGLSFMNPLRTLP